jgi:hypothetical protein
MKRSSVCALLILLAGQVFSFTVMAPPKEVVHVFANGTGDGELLYGRPDPHEPTGAACLLVLENGRVYVSDFKQNAVLLFDPQYRLRGRLSMPTDRLASFGDRVVGWNLGPDAISALVTVDWRVEDQWLTDRSWDESWSWLFFDSGYLLVPDNLDGVHALKFEGLSLRHVTIDEWQKDTESDLRPYRERYLYSAKLGYLTGDSGAFFLLNGKGQPQPKDDDGHLDSIAYDIGHLCGIDSDGNRYFDVQGERLLVADKSGNILRVFKQRYGLTEDTKVSFPTITRNGDIYYIESSPTKHRLVRIHRNW